MTKLRLKAESTEDLMVMGTMLQDAVIKVGELSWQPTSRRFALVCNRFVWEDSRDIEHAIHKRVRTGLHFDHVLSANVRGFPQTDKEHVLELLTLHATETDKGWLISLALAGGGDIRLETEVIEAYLADMGDGWNTLIRPRHSDNS